ncbi:hypothetical protein FRC03_006710 [Tulasnella sp. 419]|nr:hypothetical protein FRC03_006710 [Tulasnella sp. 419]
MDHTNWHKLTLRVPFASEAHANIAKRVIDVDKELQADAVKRSMQVEGEVLVVTFYTLTVRLARLTINSFLENIELVVRTIGEFADDANEYSQRVSIG